MNFETLASNDLLEQVRCSQCKNFLSAFPIYLSNTFEDFCGRCAAVTSSENLYRNKAYETLARFLKFPCRFQENGCREEKFPEDMLQHEEMCLYKTIECPVATPTDCAWKGALPGALQHCQDQHSDSILPQDGFEIDLSVSHDRRHLFVHDETLFIVLRKFDVSENVLKFALCYVAGKQNMKHYSSKIMVKKSKFEIVTDVDVTSFEKPKEFEIQLDSLQFKSSDLFNVFARITFDNVDNKQHCIESEMLSVIKCSRCSYYAIPPIFLCAIDSSSVICSDCKLEHEYYCKACEDEIYVSRNFNLDRLANRLNYPCKYQKNGCTFSSKPDQIQNHNDIYCPYRDYECPFLDCEWMGQAKNCTAHMLNNHEYITYTGKTLSIELQQILKEPFASPTRVIYNRGHLFKICFYKIESRIYWYMHIIGYSKKEFSHVIELVNREKDIKMSVKQKCLHLNKRNPLFIMVCFYFETEQLQKFIVDEKLIIGLDIFEENDL